MEGNPWGTKPKFFSWLRGQLRRAWAKYPIRTNYKKERRIRMPNPNTKSKRTEIWGLQCEQCTEWFPQAKVEVDHKIAAGSLNKVGDIPSFIRRLLFVGPEDLQCVCKQCHGIITYAERYDVTIEQARIRKAEIAREKDESNRKRIAKARAKKS